MKKCIFKISGIFLLSLFLAFFVSISFFHHTHIVDGNIIVHSHPYKKDSNGNPDHSHSSASFVLIHHINNILLAASLSFLPALIIYRVVFEQKSHFYYSFTRLELILNNKQRGPPLIFFFWFDDQHTLTFCQMVINAWRQRPCTAKDIIIFYF